MAADYWTEVSGHLEATGQFKEILAACGVFIVRKGPEIPPPYWHTGSDPVSALARTHWYLVHDPEAPAELQDKTVELIVTEVATTPDTGDAPTMDVITYTYRITERKAL